MNKSLITLITDYLFGQKYYAIVYYRTGTTEMNLTGEIFFTRQAVEARAEVIKYETVSTKFVCIISFRTRTTITR